MAARLVVWVSVTLTVCLAGPAMKCNMFPQIVGEHIPEKGGDESQQPPDECLFFWQASVPRMRGGVCNDNGDGGSREASRAALG